jgi:fatty acid desaturase
MPPNMKSFHNVEFHQLSAYDELREEEERITEFLDKQSDTNGLSALAGEDWTEVKHSERKKRDRILPDGVALKLMQKSDYQGFKRFFENVGILVGTAWSIKLSGVDVSWLRGDVSLGALSSFIFLYLFYAFQFQCFAFAAQHEFLRGNAWRTKWINEFALFLVGTVCFELGPHERLMHKQHHTFTNNIDKDPELTSFYTRADLENPAFRHVARDRTTYFLQFFDVARSFKYRVRKLIQSARGIPVDYTGKGWSMKTEKYSQESGIMRDLQNAALRQIFFYILIFGLFGRSRASLQALLFWWIVPVILGYPMINFFRNLEHADCEVSKDGNCLHNTRTVESNFLIRQLLWNTNYHVEHHCYPMVPFFNLPKLHELMDPYIVHNECKHFTSQNWACAKLGGWIDQQKKASVVRKSE